MKPDPARPGDAKTGPRDVLLGEAAGGGHGSVGRGIAPRDAHPLWSAQFHHANLAARVEADPGLGPMPSYAKLTRAMAGQRVVPGSDA